MKRETEIDIIARLLAHVEAGTTSASQEEGRIPVSTYRSHEHFLAEQRVLFRRLPIVVAHASELTGPGSFLTHDTLGVPLLVTRDREGSLRGFLNVCRHRGARLVREARGEDRKAFACGYHAWTYGLDGPLVHVPHAARFDAASTCDRGLVPVPVEERGGLVWALPTARAGLDVGAFLGPLADEIDGLGLADHVVQRTVTVRRRFNWKLIIDAFLDGSHIRQLHRASVARFFLDNVNLVDAFPPHIRSSVARRAIEQAKTTPREAWQLREALSLTYFLFPNTVLVLHPDWVSRITIFPESEGETAFTHTMLVPRGEDTEARRPHWEKTWGLIHGTVFEQEDMVAAEWIQGGLDSGANEVFTCGRHEHPIMLFHEAIARALEEHAGAAPVPRPRRLDSA
jgi:phenylpropionate dioxygenase-like ring-hydroxylating dioxygenase large terminal subunit